MAKKRDRLNTIKVLYAAALTAYVAFLTVYAVILPILLGYLFFELWPREMAATGEGTTAPAAATAPTSGAPAPPAPAATTATSPSDEKNIVSLFGFSFATPEEVRLIFLVMVVGAFGSYIHLATSLGLHMSEGNLSRRWFWWYAFRPFIGLSLALIFYFVIRGGFLSFGATTEENINRFGILAASGMVGLFAKQAVDKLAEVFNSLFRTVQPNPVPNITRIDPTPVPAGTRGQILQVHGADFVSQSVVRLNGMSLPTTFVSETQLTVPVPDLFLTSPSTFDIRVFNPPPQVGARPTQ